MPNLAEKLSSKKKSNNHREIDVQEFIQESYNKNVARIKNKTVIKGSNVNDTQEQYMKVALLEAEKLYADVRALYASNPERYMRANDEDKINSFKKDYGVFYDEFPIVSRYMICMMQYSQSAFERYLNKCNKSANNYNAMQALGNSYKKGEVEDEWIQLQADYVRYLWEEVQGPRRFSKKESNEVWSSAYTALKKEFKGFRDMYDNTETKVQLDDKKYRAQLASEMLTRLRNKEQSLDGKDAKNLLEILKDKLYKQNSRKMLIELLGSVEKIDPVCSARGRNQDAQIDHDEELKQKEMKKKLKIKPDV